MIKSILDDIIPKGLTFHPGFSFEFKNKFYNIRI